jgi:hypothetical protein
MFRNQSSSRRSLLRSLHQLINKLNNLQQIMNSCCNQFVRNNIQIAVCCLFLQAKILFSNKKKEKKKRHQNWLMASGANSANNCSDIRTAIVSVTQY